MDSIHACLVKGVRLLPSAVRVVVLAGSPGNAKGCSLHAGATEMGTVRHTDA